MEKILHFDKLAKLIDSTLSSAWETVSRLEEIMMSKNFYEEGQDTSFIEEEEAHMNVLLENYIQELYIQILFFLNFHELSDLVEKLNNDYRNFEDRFTELQMTNFTSVLYSPCLEMINKYIKVIKEIVAESNTFERVERIQLERLLKNTPHILKNYAIDPMCESDVKKTVYNDLRLHFPYTTRGEIPISKISKVYKPDIGIRNLKTAIEYKYADNVEEVKRAIEGINADIIGYAGSEDWKYFYAVIYMTDKFITQEQIEAEFNISNVNSNWIPIIVDGSGKRQKKNPKS